MVRSRCFQVQSTGGSQDAAHFHQGLRLLGTRRHSVHSRQVCSAQHCMHTQRLQYATHTATAWRCRSAAVPCPSLGTWSVTRQLTTTKTSAPSSGARYAQTLCSGTLSPTCPAHAKYACPLLPQGSRDCHQRSDACTSPPCVVGLVGCAQELITRLLDPDFLTRYTTDDILQHRWMRANFVSSAPVLPASLPSLLRLAPDVAVMWPW